MRYRASTFLSYDLLEELPVSPPVDLSEGGFEVDSVGLVREARKEAG
jgi:hypothetical protein